MDLTFPQFALLPAELRCKIWRQALPRRTVAFRLKMDMDAWNWSSEDDWWMHFYVAADYPTSTIPAVCFTNHEAYGELSKLYQPFKLQIESLRWAFYERFAEESTLIRMCEQARTPRFNADLDIMEWTRIHRWSQTSVEKYSPLFLATIATVRHASFERDPSTLPPLRILEAMVLNPKCLLETITITLKGEKKLRFRLAPVPDSDHRLREGDNIHQVLKTHGASLLPWFRPAATAATIEQILNGYWFDNQAEDLRQRGEKDIEQDQPGPGPHCALFRVLYPDELVEATDPDEYRETMASLKVTGGVANQWIISALTWHRFSHLARDSDTDFEVQNGLAMSSRGDGKLYHGFCSPEYGLPNRSEPWVSRCFE